MVEGTNPEKERLALRYFEALLAEAAGEREARLLELSEDEWVRTRVRDLLEQGAHTALYDRSAGFDALTDRLSQHDAEVSGTIRGYEIIRRIGHGGTGDVYEARQRDPRRTVAIKVLRQGSFDAEMRRRFQDEARLLAHLRHPNIAQVIEAGVHDETTATGERELPFLVLEYVHDACTIVEHAERSGLAPAARVRLLIDVVRAVHHGHQKGVIHRDLKPANLLVGSDGRPKVIDFGVARVQGGDLARATAVTMAGQIIGTIGFIAPEVLAGESDVADVRADVYALGAVAFRLLTGSQPFDLEGVALAEAAKRVTSTAPRNPRDLAPALGRDLEAVILQAITRDPGDRYSSAEALAADLERWLGSEPVVARRPGMLRRLQLLARRNPPLVTAITALVLVSVGAAIAGIWIQGNAVTNAEREAYRSGVVAVNAMAGTGEVSLAHDLLAKAPPAERAWEWRYLNRTFESSERVIMPFAADDSTEQVIADFDLDRDEKRLVVGHPNGRLLVLSAEDGVELAAFELDSDVRFVRFAGQNAALCAGLGTGAKIRIVDLRDGSSRLTHELPGRGVVNGIAVSADGRLGAVAGATSPFRGGKVHVFDLESGELLHRIGDDQDPPVLRVEFAGSGRYLFAGNFRGEVWRWDLTAAGGPQALRARAELFDKRGTITCLTRSGDASRIAAVGGNAVAIWNADSLEPESVMTGALSTVAWAPGGDRLIVSRQGNPMVAIARIADGPALLTAPGFGHEAALSRIVATRDGNRVFTSAYDGTIRAWRYERLAARQALNRQKKAVRAVAATESCQRILSVDSANQIAIWGRSEGRLRGTVGASARVNAIALRPGTDEFVVVGHGLWRLGSLGSPELESLESIDGDLVDVAWRPDGKVFATASTAGRVALHEPSGRLLAQQIVEAGARLKRLAFSASGERLLTGTNTGTLQEWSGVDLSPLQEVGSAGDVGDLAYVPGWAGHVVSASYDRRLIVWRRQRGGRFELYELDRGQILQRIVFHPTEPRMFTFSTNGRVSIWDTTDWYRLVTLAGHRTMIIDAYFLPATDEIVTAGMDRTVRIWRTSK
ncbi:MAG: WD40 repeat domain-containing serine/threonine protein kinase [bacterium]|nr:WD40 repeat domain-containing serine/threonine protein kinase [bacterium]